MDHFYTQICQQKIKWKKNDKKSKEDQQKIQITISWDDLNQLEQECQKSDDTCKNREIMKENIVQDIQQKVQLEFLTNTSISDINEIDITPQNIAENKIQNGEQIQRPILKRSNTSYRTENKTFTQYWIDQQNTKRQRSTKRSGRTLSMIKMKRSLMTPILKNNSQKNLKTIRVKYLNSPYSKTIKVDKNILACEFIVIAIQEYKNTPSFDQRLLIYANFSLAYQLISYDDYCDFSALPSGNNSFEDKRSIFKDQAQLYQSVNESFIKQNGGIFLELGQPINFQNLTLEVVDQDIFGIDLPTVLVNSKENPNSIILVVEDEKNEILFNFNVNLDQTIEDIFSKLQKKSSFKYSRDESYFSLKYPCVNFNNQEPLHMQFPIRLLPIHLLVVKFKYQLKNIATSFSLKDIQNNQSICQLSNNRSLSQSFIENEDQVNVLPLMFNYEEYNATKFEEDGCKNEVKIGIDYFDFYYYYKSEKNRKLSLYKITKYAVQFLLKNHQSGQSKDYKRIPTSQIILVNVLENGILEIKFHKNEDTIKQLRFMLSKIKEDDMSQQDQMENHNNNINQIAQKIQIILQQRRKIPNCLLQY